MDAELEMGSSSGRPGSPREIVYFCGLMRQDRQVMRFDMHEIRCFSGV